ncbi:MAG: site-specific integrase [Caldilineaceae bacterium]|nr:site-specific integrase [Caldilineaceae bacterium]
MAELVNQAAEPAAENTGKENTGAEHDLALAPPLRADSTLAAAVEAFDEYMVRKGFSENTIKAFRNDLKITTEYLGPDTPLLRIRTEDLEGYLHWLQHERGKPCSAKTLARRITTLKVFFGWIHGIGVLGTDPAEPVVQQTAKPPLPTILREDDIARLGRVVQGRLLSHKNSDARPYLLVNLLLQTGMKKAECARLLVTDIDVSNPQSPMVSIRYPDERHAHKNRTISLTPSIAPALAQYLEQYKPENHLFECTPRNLEYILDEVGGEAGVKHVQVGFETLRWTSAVRDYRTGTPEERLRQKMGLSKISWRETREKIFQLAGR